MEILTISGSTRNESTNSKLLLQLEQLSSDLEFQITNIPTKLPLFQSQLDANPLPEIVKEWRAQIAKAEGIIICTPEYIHNMPALIKNALEWTASSGEFVGKKVLAITLTPNEPRGEKAMQSLLWSLQALDANIVASLSLYLTEINFTSTGKIEGEGIEYLREALKLFLQ